MNSLNESRQALRELLGHHEAARLSPEFPRSATLRFLLGARGNQLGAAVLGVAVLCLVPRARRALLALPVPVLTQLALQLSRTLRK